MPMCARNKVRSGAVHVVRPRFIEAFRGVSSRNSFLLQAVKSPTTRETVMEGKSRQSSSPALHLRPSVDIWVRIMHLTNPT